MDRTFGFAFGISAVLHSAIFLPLFSIATARQDTVVNKTIVVDYVKIKQVPEVKKEMPKNVAVSRPADTPKLEMAKEVNLKEKKSVQEAAAKSAAARKELAELAKKQASIRSTKDYINYYQLIREKIRSRLKSYYRTYYGEGDVTLVFMLNSDGSVAAVDSGTAPLNANANLVRVAVASVRESSPFPPFPRELAYPKVAFDLTVSFKKQ